MIAPHPDDEVLGCGGTLLRRRAEGGATGWLIVTGMTEAAGWPADRIRSRDAEIARVAEAMGFADVYNLRVPTARLDLEGTGTLVERISAAVKAFQPTELLVPHPSDVHTDHRLVFDAAAACAKWFRYPSVLRVLAYETPSETDFGLDADRGFRPNYFVDVSGYLDRKLEVAAIYASELGAFPFPRSVDALRALAVVRGAASGYLAAEAFQLLRERH